MTNTKTSPHLVRHYKKKDRPSFTVAMLKDFMHAARPNKQTPVKNLAMFLLMIIHGLRASELADIRLADVDLANKKILVRRLKGSNDSNQSMQRLNGWDEAAVLSDWLKERKDATNADSNVLFPSQKVNADGEPKLSRVQIFRIFQSLCEKAGISKEFAHPHSFRHSLGNLMYEGGAGLEVIKQQLGHQSINSTLIYASPSQATVDNKVAKIFKAMR